MSIDHEAALARIRELEAANKEVGDALRSVSKHYESAIARAEALESRFPCDMGCVEAAEETCSRHGRTPDDIWRIVNEVIEQRDKQIARAKVAEAKVAAERWASWDQGHYAGCDNPDDCGEHINPYLRPGVLTEVQAGAGASGPCCRRESIDHGTEDCERCEDRVPTTCSCYGSGPDRFIDPQCPHHGEVVQA